MLSRATSACAPVHRSRLACIFRKLRKSTVRSTSAEWQSNASLSRIPGKACATQPLRSDARFVIQCCQREAILVARAGVLNLRAGLLELGLAEFLTCRGSGRGYKPLSVRWQATRRISANRAWSRADRTFSGSWFLPGSGDGAGVDLQVGVDLAELVADGVGVAGGRFLTVARETEEGSDRGRRNSSSPSELPWPRQERRRTSAPGLSRHGTIGEIMEGLSGDSFLDRRPAAWGRHGFDGIACGKEACRGLGTRNRLENHNCQQSTGIRSLIS